MRKAVNAALKTKYESKEWKTWFMETAKRITKELDAESTDINVRPCMHMVVRRLLSGIGMVPLVLLCCFRVNDCIRGCCSQSFDDSDDVSMFGKAKTPKKAKAPKKEAESPAEASKDQIAAIEAELRKILKDEANYDMSYAGRY